MSTRVREQKQAAKVVREQLAQERRRRRNLITSAIAVAVLVIGGLIGWAAVSSQDKAGAAPASAVDGGTAFAVGSGPVPVDLYLDFMCPACNQFEQATGPTLDQLVAAGKITVRYHPIAILDGASSTRYSTRAAAASAAAADGGRFAEYLKALYAQQPPERTPGLDDAKLIEIGRSVGLGDDFAGKVTAGTYRGWAGRVTEAAAAKGFTSTPTVVVGGTELRDRSPAAVTAAVEAATR